MIEFLAYAGGFVYFVGFVFMVYAGLRRFDSDRHTKMDLGFATLLCAPAWPFFLINFWIRHLVKQWEK